MASSKIHPVHGVNRYIWNKIQEEGLMSATNYNGLIPIVPTQELPELIRIVESQPGVTNHPYFVYNWTSVGTDQMYMVRSHQAVYILTSDDEMITRRLTSLFEEEFRDWDRAAQRVNDYLSASGASQEYLDIDYKYIYAVTVGGPEPTEIDDGPNETLITLNISFTSPLKYQ